MPFSPPEWTPADRIRKMREVRGLKQPELAARAGVHLDTIVEAEKGRREISARTYQGLAQGLEVPVEWLRSGVTPEDQQPG